MVRDKSSQRRRLEKSLNTVKLQIQKHDLWQKKAESARKIKEIERRKKEQ